jgi:hypothetical protein
MRYQHFTSLDHCGVAGPVSKMASQQKAFCVLRFEVSRSVITVQREFHARFKKDTPEKNVFFKPCTKLTQHCNQISGYLKTEHTERELLVAHEKL